MQLENVKYLYKTTLLNIDDKLRDLKILLHKKQKIEYQKKDEIDNSDRELTEKLKKINFNA